MTAGKRADEASLIALRAITGELQACSAYYAVASRCLSAKRLSYPMGMQNQLVGLRVWRARVRWMCLIGHSTLKTFCS